MQSVTSSVLIAAVPLAASRLLRVLVDYRPVAATSGAEARNLIDQERFALAILGVHFDESRMFELMSYIRGSKLNRNVPILCVLGARGSISDSTLALLRETVNALGGCEFLNLSSVPDEASGNALIARRVARYLLPPPAASANTVSAALRP